MSLYGLDIIVADKPYLCEINGVRSGMDGFRHIYGDDRVRQEVYRMLNDKHGTITWNDGFYAYLARRATRYEKHPVLVPVCDFLVAGIRRLPFVNRLLMPPGLPAEKGHLEWLDEKSTHDKQDNTSAYPFDVYAGQPSTVLNVVNELLPHPLVNNYVAEELASNKFLQFRVLRNTAVLPHLIPTALVGFGAENTPDVEEVLGHGDQFVIKPVLGSCGKGVRVLGLDHAREYLHAKGPIRNERLLLFPMFTKALSRPDFIEDLVAADDYRFELGLAVLQPFVDSRKQNRHSTVRAIVCNGRFVDAYLRENDTIPVNLSKGASAKPFTADWLPDFCERTVACLEEYATKEDPLLFRRKIYNAYSAERGLSDVESRDMFITAQRTQRLVDLFLGSTWRVM